MEYQKKTRRSFMVLSVAALTACGGGSGGGGLGFGGLGGHDTQGGDGDGQTSAFTAQERSEATLRIHDKYEALLSAKVPEPFEALKAWALTQPEYDDAGTGDLTLWTRFKDGRYFVYTDNREQLNLPEPTRAALSLRADERVASLGASGKPEIAESDLAVLLCADDSGKFVWTNNSQQRVAKTLKDSGWNIHPHRSFTIDALMGLQGKSIGLLYIASHGAILGPTGRRQYGLFSETRATEENEKKYKAEFDDGVLIYHRDRDRTKEQRGEQLPPVYGVTAQFAFKYLQFSDASLVVLLACMSGSPEALVFRDALQLRQAGTIVAWAGNSNDHGAESMEYMFDRLAGANKVDPGTPNNRAFNMDAVWEYMGTKSTAEIKPNLLVTPAVEDDKADAFIKRFGNGFDLSNPVISELEVDWKDKLIVHGNFGTEAGEVTVGGAKVDVSSWADDKLELTLPTDKADPPGSFGEVRVTARKRKSNPRVLTSWRGTVEYTFETLPQPGSSGMLSNVITVDLHVRGDAHELRRKVDGSLVRSTRPLVPASDTEVKYEAKGKNDAGLLKTAWSGSGSLPFTGNGFEGGNSLVMFASLDTVERVLKLSPAVVSQDVVTVTTTTSTGVPTTRKSSLSLWTNALGFTDPYGGDLVSFGTALPFGFGSPDVAPYDKQLPVPTLPANSGWMRVKTNGLSASPPFDDTIGR